MPRDINININTTEEVKAAASPSNVEGYQSYLPFIIENVIIRRLREYFNGLSDINNPGYAPLHPIQTNQVATIQPLPIVQLQPIVPSQPLSIQSQPAVQPLPQPTTQASQVNITVNFSITMYAAPQNNRSITVNDNRRCCTCTIL
jgi:hypothetical protein